MNIPRYLLPVFLFCAWGVTAQAATRYVTDQIKVTLRGGESTGHKIVRMLPSGTPVEVLEVHPKTGYSKVRALGAEGYVLTRQLMDQPAARDRLAEMQKRLDELQQAPDQLTGKLSRLRQEHEALQRRYRDVEQERERLRQELQSLSRTAANAVRIDKERTALRRQVAALTRQSEELRQENRDLQNRTAQNWFLIGAAVVGGGILIGLILPHLRFRRRKTSWDSL